MAVEPDLHRGGRAPLLLCAQRPGPVPRCLAGRDRDRRAVAPGPEGVRLVRAGSVAVQRPRLGRGGGRVPDVGLRVGGDSSSTGWSSRSPTRGCGAGSRKRRCRSMPSSRAPRSIRRPRRRPRAPRAGDRLAASLAEAAAAGRPARPAVLPRALVMPNRLAVESSPYLRQHAQNPVDWHPWGDAAFAEARRRDAPIFLSIGYSTCHWCHVMSGSRSRTLPSPRC